MRYRASREGKEPDAYVTSFARLIDVSPLLCASIIKAEDRKFFRHKGIDVRHTARTVLLAIRHGLPVRGVSSITQQLARNLFLTPVRSYRRKLLEAYLALMLEHVLTKKRILELYINVIEWGAGTWGCRQAALNHLGKTPDTLNLFESSFLAVLIPAPLRPIKKWYPESGRQLQSQILFELFLSGLITLEMLADALARARTVAHLISQDVGICSAVTASPQREDVERFMDVLGRAGKDLNCALSCTPTRAEMFATEFGLERERLFYKKARNKFPGNTLGIFLEALINTEHSQ
jgi:membrane peptidoglycan carboxypeptidase